MASCKDCLHHKICEGYYEDEGTPLMASWCKEGEICNQFEDKSKYVCLQVEKKTIGKKIKELRKSNKLSQDKLGELVACDRQKIADWERNKSEPKIEYIIKLSKVFNVSSDYLLGLSKSFTTDTELQINKQDLANIIKSVSVAMANLAERLTENN